MKKKAGKLVLNKETVKLLTEAHLEDAAGRDGTSVCSLTEPTAGFCLTSALGTCGTVQCGTQLCF